METINKLAIRYERNSVLSSSSVGCCPVHHGVDSHGEAQAKEETHAPTTEYAGQSTRIVVTPTTARDDDE